MNVKLCLLNQEEEFVNIFFLKSSFNSLQLPNISNNLTILPNISPKIYKNGSFFTIFYNFSPNIVQNSVLQTTWASPTPLEFLRFSGVVEHGASPHVLRTPSGYAEGLRPSEPPQNRTVTYNLVQKCSEMLRISSISYQIVCYRLEKQAFLAVVSNMGLFVTADKLPSGTLRGECGGDSPIPPSFDSATPRWRVNDGQMRPHTSATIWPSLTCFLRKFYF